MAEPGYTLQELKEGAEKAKAREIAIAPLLYAEAVEDDEPEDQ